MIDFTTVTGEFRGVVSRRRSLLTFLGTLFAALGIFVQNVLQGNLPGSLRLLESHLFAFYGLMLAVPSLVLALRSARLHAGMVLHGILYVRLLRDTDFVPAPDLARAARHNFLGVSFLMFLLTALLAGFSTALLAIALGLPGLAAVGAGAGAVVVALALYFRFHATAARMGLDRIAAEPCAPYDRNEWQAHVAASLDDVNQDMLAVLGFVALIVFSTFEGLSNLGKISAQADLASEDVTRHAPVVFCLLMVIATVVGLVIHLRLRVAQGTFSLQLDPADRPFDPLRLTDSFLGYVLLAFLLGVGLFVLGSLLAPDRGLPLPLGVAGAAFALAIVAEKAVVLQAGRRLRPPPARLDPPPALPL